MPASTGTSESLLQRSRPSKRSLPRSLQIQSLQGHEDPNKQLDNAQMEPVANPTNT